MNYLLDTNILVDYLRKKRKLEENIAKENLAISVITYAELLYGVYKSANKELAFEVVKNLVVDFSIKIIDLNSEIVDQFAKTKAYLDKSGQKLEDFDILIAATALTYSYILVTRNTKHFNRILKLKLL